MQKGRIKGFAPILLKRGDEKGRLGGGYSREHWRRGRRGGGILEKRGARAGVGLLFGKKKTRESGILNQSFTGEKQGVGGKKLTWLSSRRKKILEGKREQPN